MERFGSKARHTRAAEQVALAGGPIGRAHRPRLLRQAVALSLAAICFS
jgi:hypothetical protein